MDLKSIYQHTSREEIRGLGSVLREKRLKFLVGGEGHPNP